MVDTRNSSLKSLSEFESTDKNMPYFIQEQQQFSGKLKYQPWVTMKNERYKDGMRLIVMLVTYIFDKLKVSIFIKHGPIVIWR